MKDFLAILLVERDELRGSVFGPFDVGALGNGEAQRRTPPVDVPAIRSNICAIRWPVRRSISARIMAGMIPRIPPPSMERMVNRGIDYLSVLVSCWSMVVARGFNCAAVIVCGVESNLVFGGERSNNAGGAARRMEAVMNARACWNGCDIVVEAGDITKLDTDAIVNAANSGLWAGGGVCGAIHRAAGAALGEACKQFVAESGPVHVGQAAITPGGALRAKYVIHAVGPVYGENPAKAPELLAAAYVNSLRLRARMGFPASRFRA